MKQKEYSESRTENAPYRLFLADTKNSLPFEDMIERVQRADNGFIYFYNRNYIVGKTAQYEIFDGIWIVYHDLVPNQQELYPFEADGLMQINYCISGRCELHYKNSKVFCIGANDSVIALLKNRQYRHSFPLGNYSGISIVTTKLKLDGFLQTIFPNSALTGEGLFDKLEKQNEYIVLTNHPEINAIMQELKCPGQNYFREKAILKFAELIILLMQKDMDLYTEKKYFDKQLVNKVKHIKRETTGKIEVHMKIKEIAARYQISSKAFSDCFKEIYGKTYYAFFKEFRIKKAADLLQEEKHTISEIAMMVGYQNASKFSKAFFDVMGETPTRYRRGHLSALLD